MKKLKISVFLVLLVIGLADTLYLSFVEIYPNLPLFCPHTKTVNCASVLASSYAFVFGIPLAFYALVWFLIAMLFFVMKARDARNIWFVMGLGGVIYSVSSMSALGEICIYCSALDIILIAIAVLGLYSTIKKRL